MKTLFSIICLFTFHTIGAQIITKPNFSTASHPMTVEKIEQGPNQVIIWLSIENQSETGYFCADKNIYVMDALTNKKYKLIQSKGIPVCPENHYFQSVGEILTFQLIFPRFGSGTKYINLIEECQANCFTIKGIILDPGLNKEIDLGYHNYLTGKPELSLAVFQQSIKNYPDYPFGILYFNLIQLFAEKNDFGSAKNFYRQLVNSKFQDKNEVISRLKQQAYYTRLIF